MSGITGPLHHIKPRIPPLFSKRAKIERMGRPQPIDLDLPGADLVEAGIRDLAQDKISVESLLVSIGAPRLRRIGFVITDPIQSPNIRLYELLAQSDPNGAHSRYNSYIRRLISFERAAECVS